jgi:hypothetical protein
MVDGTNGWVGEQRGARVELVVAAAYPEGGRSWLPTVNSSRRRKADSVDALLRHGVGAQVDGGAWRQRSTR